MKWKLPRWRPPGGLRPWVAGISLLLVLLALWSHGQEVLALAPDQRGWALLVFGLALTVVAQWANGLAWWALLRWLQLPLPLLEMVQLFVRTNLLKYLPGGVWHQVDRVRLLRQRGASGRRALLSVLLEALLMVIAAFCLVPFGGLQAGLGVVCPLALLLLRPRWLNRLLERLLRSKRKLLQDSDEEALNFEPLRGGSLAAPAAGVPLPAVAVLRLCLLRGLLQQRGVRGLGQLAGWVCLGLERGAGGARRPRWFGRV